MRNRIFALICAVLFNTFVGGALALAVGAPPMIGAIGANLLGAGLSFVKLPQGMRVGILVEAWTGQVVEHFTHAQEGTFLDGVPDYSQYAENDVIHLSDVSGDPTVLVDNITYPLAIEDLPDGDVAISLSKFETLPTRVTDDELYAASFDKMAVAKTRHGNKLGEAMLDKALHAFAPIGDSAETPVIVTTGGADGNRAKCTRENILALKKACDKAKMPKKGRRLVLCNDHINDLLELDQKFKDQYHNYETGSIGKMYGFDIYEYPECPQFNATTKTKKSFGSIPSAGDFEASIAFYVPRMFKCKGSTKPYISEAKNDPVNKQNLMSYTTRFVALPQKRDGACAALISGNK
jgi:hypothetical protein